MPTLESSLVILDRASAPVRGIRREVRGLQGDAEKAGRALDDMAGPKAARDLQKVAEDTRVLRGALRGVRDELPILNRGMDAYSRRLDTARRNTDKMSASSDRLALSLRALGAIDAHPKVNVDGIAAARLEVAALRADLRALGNSNATARASVIGSSRGGGGGGGPRTAAYLGSGGAGIVTTRTRALAGAAIVALPVVQALGGATVALGGSLLGAGLGAGAVGVAGGGVLAAGLGSIVAIAKPASKELGNAMKAQQKYTDAVADFGRKSTQAKNAHREMTQAFGDDAQLKRATQQLGAFRKEWNALSKPGREAFFGGVGDVAQIGRRASPRLAANANIATRAARGAVTSQARFLAGDYSLDTMAILTREFARDLPIAERSLENVELVFERIARASRPFFHEGVLWVEQTTAGWEKSTQDVGKLRREIGGYVGDLKTWAHLTDAAFGLAKDVLMGGRPAGGSMVEDLTKTLDRWDRWVQRNPEKMDRFFKEAASDTDKIAGSVVDIVHGLNSMATEMRPLIDPLTRMLSLFSNVAGVIGPGGAATAYLGLRTLRTSIANRGAGAGAAAMPLMLGSGRGPSAAGGAALAAYPSYQMMRANATAAGSATRTNWTGWTAGEAAAGGRFAGAGSAIRGGLGTAGRIALPALAVNAAIGASTPGSLDERIQSLVSGATLGLVPSPVTRAMARQQGATAAASDVSALGAANTPAQVRRQIADLQRKRSVAASQSRAGPGVKVLGMRVIDRGGGLLGTGGGPTEKEALKNAAAVKQYTAAIKDLRAQERALNHDEETRRNQASREHAGALTQSFGKAFDTLSAAHGPEAAMDKTVRNVLDKMHGMNRTGAKILGENVLAWGRAQAKANPKLTGQVDWLTKHIEMSFSKMGDHVQIVNGHILTGSAAEWRNIGAAIATPAEAARVAVGKSFDGLQQQAVGSLRAMGYSSSEATALVKGISSGKISAASASATTGAGQPRLQSDSNKAKNFGGKGIGDGTGVATRGASGGGTAALMGSKPGLEGYAQQGARFGLSVTSGLRPGAITSSGNVSLHASGDAIDESGPPANMLRFAKFMAGKYGKGLDELIHTPLGFGIKNGQKVPLSFWGSVINAQHQDHVHVGDRTPSGGGGGIGGLNGGPVNPGKISLKGGKSGLHGVPGGLADTAMAAMAKGLSAKLNAKIGSIGSDGGFAATAPDPSVGGDVAGFNHLYPRHLEGTPGVQLTPGQVAMIAASVGLPGTTFAQIAHGESDYQPGVQQRDPGDGNVGYGMWQMTPHAWGSGSAAMKHMQSLGGIPAMFNPVINAEMAKYLYDAAGGIGPWYGTKYVTSSGRGKAGVGVGDGLGWDRPASSGGGPTINVRGASGGGRSVTVSPNITITGGGMNRRHIEALVHARVAAIADEVLAMLGEEAMVTM